MKTYKINKINEFIKNQAVRSIDNFQDAVREDDAEGPTNEYKVIFRIFGKPVCSNEGNYSFKIKMTDGMLKSQNDFYNVEGLIPNAGVDGITYWEYSAIFLIKMLFRVSREEAKNLVTAANLTVDIKKI